FLPAQPLQHRLQRRALARMAELPQHRRRLLDLRLERLRNPVHDRRILTARRLRPGGTEQSRTMISPHLGNGARRAIRSPLFVKPPAAPVRESCVVRSNEVVFSGVEEPERPLCPVAGLWPLESENWKRFSH